jgi:type I restriction enzyme S subunit
MNETLEAMARALFKSWFIDFDPVRAKMKSYNLSIPKHLADLFPDSLVDSDLGEIPKGWRVVPLSDITSVITKGTTPTQSDIDTASTADAHVQYVRVNAISDDGAIHFDKLTTIPKSVHLGVLKRSILQVNDVLYTIAGTIGRSAIVEESLLPANTNQAVALLRPKPTIPPSFLALTMRQDRFREELHMNIVHAVQANLSLGMLSKARTVLPPENTLPQLFTPIERIVKRVSATRVESRILAALRDTLLPKLISGELRVEDAERIIGECA